MQKKYLQFFVSGRTERAEMACTVLCDGLEKIFEIDERALLGKGAMGSVKIYTHISSATDFACKIIPKQNISPARLDTELRIGRLVSINPQFAACRDCYQDAHNVYLIMDLCHGGSLLDYIKKQGFLHEQKCRQIFSQIAQAMEYCHFLGIIHRDLKTENILLADEQGMDVKVADFGLSQFYYPGNKFCDLVGTLSYMAPEVLKGCSGSEADVWSAGLVLYEMLCGKQLFPHRSSVARLFHNICHQPIDLHQLNVSKEVKDLIYSMLLRDPLQRPSFSQVLQHPWFTAVRNYHDS